MKRLEREPLFIADIMNNVSENRRYYKGNMSLSLLLIYKITEFK